MIKTCSRPEQPKVFAALLTAALLAAISLPLLFFAGCAQQKSAESYASGGGQEYDLNYGETGYSPEMPAGAEGNAAPGSRDREKPADIPPEAGGKTRKLIRTARLTIEAGKNIAGENMSLALQKIEEMAERYDGYIGQSRLDSSSIQCTIRVPSASFDSLLAGLPELGKIVSRDENSEDVTLKYYDLEGRKKKKKTLLVTFQSYLAKANTVEDIMSVENRIADLQNEIDWLGSQLTQLASLIDYAAVSVYLFNPNEIRPYSLGDRLLRLFGDFGKFARSAVIAVTAVIVFGIPILVMLFLAYWLLLGRVGLLKKAFRLVNGSLANSATVSKEERTKDSNKDTTVNNTGV